MQGFRDDIKLIIIKSSLWIGIFAFLIFGVRNRNTEKLGNNLQRKRIIAATQTFVEVQSCKKPYFYISNKHENYKDLKNTPLFRIHESAIYYITIDILLYIHCKKGK